MEQSAYPTKFAVPWASGAGSSYVTPVIPVTTSAAGRASLTLGFPPACFQPVASGGTPPWGEDVNGGLYMLSAQAQADQAGAVPQFDAAFATAIGGYPANSILASSVTVGLFWLCAADGNTTNPDASGATNWTPLLGSSGTSATGLWFKLPSGVIVQFGSGKTVSGFNDYVAFPITFPNAVFGAPIVSEQNAVGWTPNCNPSTYGSTIASLSGFYVAAARWNGTTMTYDGGAAYTYVVSGY